VAPQQLIEELWIRHDYLTLSPSLLSDYLGAIAMEPQRREALLTRTRQIICNNLPPVEEWFMKRGDIFTYVRPRAGAIMYCKYNLPIKSTELIERLRMEQSVLLVPGDQFGLSRGIRIGYGYDVGETIKGLDRTDALIRTLK
jgi:hypothetical protein